MYFQFKMKKQFIGFVLSALLFTTFGHEILTRHQQHHSSRIAHSQARSPLLSHSRKNGELHHKKCITYCYIPGRQPCSNLTVSYNLTSGLISTVNETAQVALVIDVNASLVAIFYQSKETIILINYEKSIGVVISGKAANEIGWQKGDNLQKISSLTVFWSLGKKSSGTFEISTVKTEIAVLIQSSLLVLSSGDYYVSEHESASFLVNLSVRWSVAIKQTTGLVEGGSVTAESSLKLIIGAYQGLARIVSKIEGGRSTAIKKHVTISLDTLINVKSTLELTGRLIVAFAQKGIDLKEVFGEHEISLAELFVLAGGNSSEDITGLLKVILEVKLVIYNQSSIEKVVDVLIDFFTNNPNLNYQRLAARLRAVVNIVLKLIKEEHLENKLSVWVKCLEDTLENKLFEKNVNISAIINILLATDDSTPLERIVKIVITVDKEAVPEAIGYILYRFFGYIVQNQLNVIINLYLQVLSNFKDILAIIRRYLDTAKLSSKEDCIEALSKTPVISDIIKGLNNSLSESTNGSITLDNFPRSESFFKYIKLIVQIVITLKNDKTTTEPASPPGDGTTEPGNNGTSDDKDDSKGNSSHETGSSDGKGKGGDGGNVDISDVGNGNSNSTNLKVDNSGGKGGNVSSEGGHEVHQHDGSGSGSENYKGGNSSVDVSGGKGGNTTISDTGNGGKNTNVSVNGSGGDAGTGSSEGGEARSKTRHHAKEHEKHGKKH